MMDEARLDLSPFLPDEISASADRVITRVVSQIETDFHATSAIAQWSTPLLVAASLLIVAGTVLTMGGSSPAGEESKPTSAVAVALGIDPAIASWAEGEAPSAAELISVLGPSRHGGR